MNRKIKHKVFTFPISILTYVNRIIPIFGLYNYISQMLGITKVQLFLIKGVVRDRKNFSTTILFVGKGVSALARANYYAYNVFSQIEEVVNFGEVLYRQVNLHNFKIADIIVVDAKIDSDKNLLKKGFLLLPEVCFELDLTCSIPSLIKRCSKRRRRNIRKLQKLNYSYIICRNDNKKFDFYYWKMYLPYIRSRFGAGANPVSYLSLKKLYEKDGGLIFVLKNNLPIAAISFRVRKDTLYSLTFGAYSGDQKYCKDFASMAALFFLIQWSKKEGLKRLNYGATVPFLNSGIFQYKKEWGMFVEMAAQPFHAMKIVCLNEFSLFFLANNPFIISHMGVMTGLIFVDHILSEGELQSLFSKYFFAKMDSLIVVSCYKRKNGETKETDFYPYSQSMPIVLEETVPKMRNRTCVSYILRNC